jgi:ubiquinone/menaquinone biosynthesis C-methylase UbiE
VSKYFSEAYLAEHWMSYYYQVSEALKIIRDLFKKISKSLNILEVGPGNKITSFILSQSLKAEGIMHDIVTMDVDRRVGPNIVSDVRCLPFKDDVFDVSLAFEVLEHIPFEHVPLALQELRRTTKGYVMLSLPHNSLYLAIAVKLPKTPLKTLFLRLFDLPIRHIYDGEHYWEIGTKNHSMSKVRKVLEERFKIVRSFRSPLFPYHHFFLLEPLR